MMIPGILELKTIQEAFRAIWKVIGFLPLSTEQNINLQGRRIVNAGQSAALTDYVTKGELTDAVGGAGGGKTGALPGIVRHSELTELDYASAGHTGFVPSTRTISTTAPITGGGNLSADRTFAIPAATGAVNGYLTSADWTTFNNKVGTARLINTTAPLTGGGDLSADRTIALTTPLAFGYGGTGTATFTTGSVWFSGAGAKAEDNANFFWDNTNKRLGICTAGAPTVSLDVGGSVKLGLASTDLITITGRLLVRTAATDPQDVVPGNRPAGTVGEIAYYAAKLYLCVNAGVPTWEKFTSA